MNPADALSMISKDNLKAKEAHTINLHLISSADRRVTRKEDIIRKVVKGTCAVDLIAFEAKVDGIDISCRWKDLDQVLKIFLLDGELFVDHSKIKHKKMVVRRDHDKVVLTVLIRLCVEFHDNLKVRA